MASVKRNNVSFATKERKLQATVLTNVSLFLWWRTVLYFVQYQKLYALIGINEFLKDLHGFQSHRTRFALTDNMVIQLRDRKNVSGG